MQRVVGSVVSMVVGAVLAGVSIYGLVQSQVSNDGGSPVDASQNAIDYGSNS